MKLLFHFLHFLFLYWLWKQIRSLKFINKQTVFATQNVFALDLYS